MGALILSKKLLLFFLAHWPQKAVELKSRSVYAHSSKSLTINVVAGLTCWIDTGHLILNVWLTVFLIFNK